MSFLIRTEQLQDRRYAVKRQRADILAFVIIRDHLREWMSIEWQP